MYNSITYILEGKAHLLQSFGGPMVESLGVLRSWWGLDSMPTGTGSHLAFGMALALVEHRNVLPVPGLKPVDDDHVRRWEYKE